MPQATSELVMSSRLVHPITQNRSTGLQLREEMTADVSSDLTAILSPARVSRQVLGVDADGERAFTINLLTLSPGARNDLRQWIQKTRAILDHVERSLDDQARKTEAAK